MAEHKSIEERLAAIEHDLADLKQRMPAPGTQQNWIHGITGSMRNYPEFDEVVRLGQQIREADRSQEPELPAS